MSKKANPRQQRLAKLERGFNLDCNNYTKSKMQQYNPLTDKYMKYMIPASVINYVNKKQKKHVEKQEFRSFLSFQKTKLLNKKQLFDMSMTQDFNNSRILLDKQNEHKL